MRITTCFTSAMVPLQPLGSALAAVLPRSTLAAVGPPPRPAAAAAATPSPVACRNRRRLTPGPAHRPGRRADPGVACGCSRELSELVMLLHPRGAGVAARTGTGAEPGGHVTNAQCA